MRSTINAPPAITTSTKGHAMSPPAPHQLWPVPNNGIDTSSARAAGLKMCPRGVATRYLEADARPAIHSVWIIGVSGLRIIATIAPDSSALVGQLSFLPVSRL